MSALEPLQPPASRTEARSQAAWARLRKRLRAVSPSDVGRLIIFSVVLAAIVWLAFASWPALLPFVIGGFAAYALLPIVNLLDRLLPRPLAALLTLAAFFVVLSGLLYLLVPGLAEQVLRLYRNVLNPDALAVLDRRLDEMLRQLPEPSRSVIQNYVSEVSETLRERFEALISALAAASVTGLLSLVGTLSTIIGVLLLPLWMLGLLIGQRSAMPALRRALPDLIEADVVAVIRIVNRALNAFLRGQLVLGLAVGVTLYLEVALLERYTSIDVRYPVLMALFAAVMQLVPQVGPLLGLLVFGLFGLSISPQIALLVMLLYIVAVLLVTNLVASRLQRQLNDLNPVVLVLLIAALSQFGLVWALLSAPLLAIVRDVLRYVYGRMADPSRPAGVLPGEEPPRTRTATATSRGAAYRRGVRPR